MAALNMVFFPRVVLLLLFGWDGLSSTPGIGNHFILVAHKTKKLLQLAGSNRIIATQKLSAK